MSDFLQTLGVLIVISLGACVVLLAILTVKALLVRGQRNKIVELANRVGEMSKEMSDLKVYAYSMRCENDVHTETIKRKDRDIECKDKEIKLLRDEVDRLLGCIPIPPEGFRFERIAH